MKPLVSHTRLLNLLSYDPELGVLYWRTRMGRGHVGHAAGVLTDEGYLRIRIDGRDYMAHRLAWFYVHAKWPTELDHANGDPGDNRISNLRECSRSQNLANTRLRKGREIPKGVRRSGRKFSAFVRANKKTHYLGVFPTAEEASRAYLLAARQHFGDFANSGSPFTPALGQDK